MSPGPLTTADLVDMGDLDALLIRIDHLCADRDWAGVLDLRDRCRRAIERGRQLWPAASHAEYRLALEAPGRAASAVLVAGTGRFALGPLAEVAASTHTWAELRPHLEPTPEAGMVAHERVVRGEDLTGDDHVDPTVLELPLRLQPWEPAYPLATYRAHKLEVADVPAPPLHPVEAPVGTTPNVVDDAEATRALEELAMAWKQESNGTATAVAVAGDAARRHRHPRTRSHRATRRRDVGGRRLGRHGLDRGQRGRPRPASGDGVRALLGLVGGGGGGRAPRRLAVPSRRPGRGRGRPALVPVGRRVARHRLVAPPGGGGPPPRSGVGGGSHRPRLTGGELKVSPAGPGPPHPGTGRCGR